jgi:drug/metabolite transporter (DMT)-like permease
MKDAVNGRYKAFLFVGVAYFVTAVLAPLLVLWWKGASWEFTPSGMTWSLLAGIVGAIGAFCVLLAFGAGGAPSVVMAIVFAGAPIINAIVALTWHPPAGGLASLRWQFVAGIVLAAVGGCMVTFYKPPPGKPVHAAPEAASEKAVE